mgnify:CR=1 FL=1
MAALITSCGGNPPPRLSPAPGPPTAQPVRVGSIPLNPPPPVIGQSAIVIDVVSGRVLYAKNADEPRAVASTQKIVTALCALDEPESTVEIETNAVFAPSPAMSAAVRKGFPP